jgi:hypothetical protein
MTESGIAGDRGRTWKHWRTRPATFLYFSLMETPAFNRELSAWLTSQFATLEEMPLSGAIARSRGITSQAANPWLRRPVEAGVLDARLHGRRKLYRLSPIRQFSTSITRETFREDVVWQTVISPEVARFPEPAALRVLEYGATEILNNARDGWAQRRGRYRCAGVPVRNTTHGRRLDSQGQIRRSVGPPG